MFPKHDGNEMARKFCGYHISSAGKKNSHSKPENA
jgi:hypothetical protein